MTESARNQLQIGIIDHVFEIWNTAAKIGVVMVVNQRRNFSWIEAGFENLHHDYGEVRPAATIDKNCLVAIDYQIRVTAQT